MIHPPAVIAPIDHQADADEYRPTADETPRIALLLEAEWSGFSIGCNGCQASAPSTMPPAEREAFERGNRAGFREYVDSEMARWPVEPIGPREVHHAELIRSVAHVAVPVEDAL